MLPHPSRVLLQNDSSRSNQQMDRSPIPGMETIVAKVRRYEGTHRFDLIKLINHYGASYVRVLSSSPPTRCAENSKGGNISSPKRLRITVVNHRSEEDCIKQGKRVDECPLHCKDPTFSVIQIHKRQRVHLQKRVPDFVGWVDSTLLTEDLFSDFRKGKNACELKPCKGTASKPKDLSSGRYLAEDIPVSRLLGFERHENTDSYSAMHSSRGKKKILRSEMFTTHSNMSLSSGKSNLPDNIGSISMPESSNRGQRLTKKTIGGDHLETVLLDSDDDFEPIRFNHEKNDAADQSERADCEIPNEIVEAGETSDASLKNNVGSRNGDFEDIEQITNWNHLRTNLNVCSEVALPATEGLDTIESLKEKSKAVVQPEPITRSPSSTELSCVICWTEFSPTRGILRCGHRFCYSCIQNWADQMTSRRKFSACPLCKARFTSIKKVEGAAASDQKIYSQTISSNFSTTYVMLSKDRERDGHGAEPPSSEVCCVCRCQLPEDLLVSCHLCKIRYIHSYCLDSIMLLPWTCVPCKELQMRYRRSSWTTVGLPNSGRWPEDQRKASRR